MKESGMGSRFSVPTALALEREVLFESNTRKSLPVKMASFRISKSVVATNMKRQRVVQEWPPRKRGGWFRVATDTKRQKKECEVNEESRVGSMITVPIAPALEREVSTGDNPRKFPRERPVPSCTFRDRGKQCKCT